jgi:hypothetical protein
MPSAYGALWCTQVGANVLFFALGLLFLVAFVLW